MHQQDDILQYLLYNRTHNSKTPMQPYPDIIWKRAILTKPQQDGKLISQNWQLWKSDAEKWDICDVLSGLI